MGFEDIKTESNYRVVYEKYWKDIKLRAPEDITSERAVLYCNDTRQFVVTFFEEKYIVDCNQKLIYRKSDGHVPDAVATIIVLNYLAFAQAVPKSDPRWVGVKEIQGGILFYSAFHKTAITVLIETFGHQASKLKTVARLLGGQTSPFGNTSVIIKAFPEIPLCVIIWEGDEEVPANATILYDRSINFMLESAIIIDLGVYLAGLLKKFAAE